MAGVVTIAEEVFGSVKKIKFAWTSTDGGVASRQTTHAYNGVIERLVTVPGAGDNQPTNQYDVTITDEDDTDVLMGAGADRLNTATEQVLASLLGVVANDRLTLNIVNAGDTKKGTAYLYLR